MDIDVASARMTRLNEEEVVVITIPAPEKATQQHCERLRPRGLEGCIIQVPPVVKLRHAKVDSITEETSGGMHSSRYRIVWCVFSPRRLFGEM